METKKRIFSIFLTLSILLMLLPMEVFAAGDIWYVKTDGVGDGSSWENASSDLRNIMDNANPNDQVWVAAGTYTPGTNADDTFTLNKGVKVYGGFVGTENELSERDWVTNETILSGNDVNYHVVTGATDATPDDTRLDGFTVKEGNANGSGGGMYNVSSSPTVANCTFSGNTATYEGGGMCNHYSNPTVVNCTFSGNTSTSTFGGGMYNHNSNPTLTNCTFSGNTANSGGGMYNQNSDPTIINCNISGNTAYSGGGMSNHHSNPTVVNCTFSGNTANDSGGGMDSYNSNPTLTNCTFSGNTANSGGGMYNYNSGPTLANTILWDNTAPAGWGPDIYQFDGTLDLKNCVVDLDNKYDSANDPTEDFTNVIKTDPKLIPMDKNGNIEAIPANAYIFGLGQDSSAINAGLGVGVMVNAVAVPNTDQRGIARPQGTGVDIGAFEAVLYTVTYDNNGGEGTMTAGNAFPGVPFELPACTFTAPAGKLFMTWAIGSAGSATTADAGTTYTFAGDTTVYAV
jgi:parallel beta-helix repeat protein